MSTSSDTATWARARDGDEDAFGVIFDRYADRIFRFCFRRTADAQLAEDLTSVVFLEAWRRRSTVSPDSVAAWLFGVALNVVRNGNRSVQRHAIALSRLPPPTVEPDFADEVVDRADIEAEMRSVLDAVAVLPSLDQEIIAFCIWDELSTREAAQALGMSEGAVRTRLHRARRRLEQLKHTSTALGNAQGASNE
jgi:RNA polymerase sigma-70 factor (ECF subfamily)